MLESAFLLYTHIITEWPAAGPTNNLPSTDTFKILNKCLKWYVSVSVSDFLHNYKNLNIAVNPYL